MIRWEERQRDGTGISHLGERKEEEGLVQSSVEEKCGHLLLSCSVSFLLGGFVLSNLASASASGAGAKSAVPPPLVAATYCLFPLPPAAAVFCANPGHLAHRRSPTRTRAPRYNGWVALQLPRRRGRASGSAAAICDTPASARSQHSSYIWWDSSANLWHRRPCSQDRAPTSSLPNTGASCASLSAAAARGPASDWVATTAAARAGLRRDGCALDAVESKPRPQ